MVIFKKVLSDPSLNMAENGKDKAIVNYCDFHAMIYVSFFSIRHTK